MMEDDTRGGATQDSLSAKAVILISEFEDNYNYKTKFTLIGSILYMFL